MPRTAEVAADDEIDLGAVLATLWGGKLVIASVMALGIALGMYTHASRTPELSASGLIQLENRAAELALPDALRDLSDTSPQIVTETEVIRSRIVLARAVAASSYDVVADARVAPVIGQILLQYDLGLPEIEALRPFGRKGTSIRVDHLEVPPDWLGLRMVLTVTGPGTFEVALPNEKRLTGSVNETLSDPDTGFGLRVSDLLGPVGREFLLLQRSELNAVRAMRDRLTVSERGRGSGILEIQFRSREAQRAIRVVDAVIAAYLGQNIDRSNAEIDSGLAFVQEQIVQAERGIEEAAAALDRYRLEQSSLDLSFESQGLLSQLSEIDQEIRLLSQRAEDLAERYTPNHPVYRTLLRDRERLEERRVELQAEAEKLPEQQREVLNLTRDLRLAEGTYTDFRQRMQNLMVLRASTVGNVRILESAEQNPGSGRPSPMRSILLYGLVAAVLGAGAVFLREWLRRSIQGPEEIEAQGVSVFGTIAYTPAADEKRGRGRVVGLLAVTTPNDIAIEGLRSLRTSLHFGMLDSASRSLAITSAAPDAGKSFTTANLGVVMAQAGQRICIIDADLRRGRLRRYFNVRRERAGLTEFLSGDATLDEVLIETDVSGLWFIHSGRLPPNPSELLMRPTLRELVKHLDDRFDLSLFDCPPALAVTDPLIVARATGATMAIVRHGVTEIGEVMSVRKTFETAGLQLAGAVLNGFDPKQTSYGYAYRYRYTYNYTYRYKYDRFDPKREN